MFLTRDTLCSCGVGGPDCSGLYEKRESVSVWAILMMAASYTRLPHTPRPRAVHSEKEDKTQEHKAEEDIYTTLGSTDGLRGSLRRNERLKTKKGFLMLGSSTREGQMPRKET